MGGSDHEGTFTKREAPPSLHPMSTITVIMEPAADGTLHLPVPAEWRHQRIRVKAEREVLAKPQEDPDLTRIAPQPGCLKGFRMAADYDEPLEDFKEYTE